MRDFPNTVIEELGEAKPAEVLSCVPEDAIPGLLEQLSARKYVWHVGRTPDRTDIIYALTTQSLERALLPPALSRPSGATPSRPTDDRILHLEILHEHETAIQWARDHAQEGRWRVLEAQCGQHDAEVIPVDGATVDQIIDYCKKHNIPCKVVVVDGRLEEASDEAVGRVTMSEVRRFIKQFMQLDKDSYYVEKTPEGPVLTLYNAKDAHTKLFVSHSLPKNFEWKSLWKSVSDPIKYLAVRKGTKAEEAISDWDPATGRGLPYGMRYPLSLVDGSGKKVAPTIAAIRAALDATDYVGTQDEHITLGQTWDSSAYEHGHEVDVNVGGEQTMYDGDTELDHAIMDFLKTWGEARLAGDDPSLKEDKWDDRESAGRDNTDRFQANFGDKQIVVMKDHGSFEKAGDTLTILRSGVVCGWLYDSGSYVDVNHSFGDPNDWKAVGLQMDLEKYEAGTEGRKEVGNDQWQLSFLLDQLERGNYKFTANHEKMVKRLQNFVEEIDGSDDDDDEDVYDGPGEKPEDEQESTGKIAERRYRYGSKLPAMPAHTDLRKEFEDTEELPDGTVLYRQGKIIQVWYPEGDHETFRMKSEEAAAQHFEELKARWSEEPVGSPREAVHGSLGESLEEGRVGDLTRKLFDLVAPIAIYHAADVMYERPAKIAFKHVLKIPSSDWVACGLDELPPPQAKLDDPSVNDWARAAYRVLFELVVNEAYPTWETFYDQYGALGVKDSNGVVVFTGDDAGAFPWYVRSEELIQRLDDHTEEESDGGEDEYVPEEGVERMVDRLLGDSEKESGEKYQVIVGNVGMVYCGNNEAKESVGDPKPKCPQCQSTDVSELREDPDLQTKIYACKKCGWEGPEEMLEGEAEKDESSIGRGSRGHRCVKCGKPIQGARMAYCKSCRDQMRDTRAARGFRAMAGKESRDPVDRAVDRLLTEKTDVKLPGGMWYSFTSRECDTFMHDYDTDGEGSAAQYLMHLRKDLSSVKALELTAALYKALRPKVEPGKPADAPGQEGGAPWPGQAGESTVESVVDQLLGEQDRFEPRGKDLYPKVECTNCGREVDPDESVKCRECGRVVCRNCTGLPPRDDLCAECAEVTSGVEESVVTQRTRDWMCAQCGSLVHKDELRQCEKCGNFVCKRCLGLGDYRNFCVLCAEIEEHPGSELEASRDSRSEELMEGDEQDESNLRVIQDEESDDTFFVDGYDEIGKRVSVKAVLSGDSKSYHVTGKYGDEDKRIDQVVNLPAYLDKAVDSEESVKEAVLAAIAFSEDAGEIAPE